MERRHAGGGGGALGWLLILALAVGVPVGYLVTAKQPTRPVAADTAAVEVFGENGAMGYRLFRDPDWARLNFSFRGLKPPKARCTESAWTVDEAPVCGTGRPII